MSENIKRQTLDNLILEYGEEDLNPILAYIDTVPKLIQYGKAFIEGKLYRHVGYYARFGEECSKNYAHRKDNLLKLHDHNCYTYSGQSYLREDKDIDKVFLMQKSYINFLCPENILRKIVPKLKENNSIYFQYCYQDEKFSNFPHFPYEVTTSIIDKKKSYSTNIFEIRNVVNELLTYVDEYDNEYENECYLLYHPKYNRVITSLCNVEIAAVDYVEVDEILLNILNKVK